MKVAVFSTRPYDREYLAPAAEDAGHSLSFFEPRLTTETSKLADGFRAVCVFVNDRVDRQVMEAIAAGGTQLLALRSAGFNHVDLAAAAQRGVAVARVPAYSPYAVAEHTVGMILALNRKLYRAYNRVREGNFSIAGLLGFDLHGRTVGIVGTGKIGAGVARILHGFGCQLLLHDVRENDELKACGARYVPLAELLSKSDVISLHCPLLPQTQHLIDTAAIEQMRAGVMLINTSRGGLVDTQAVVDGLKSGQIGYLGLDVYEEEESLFFEDMSSQVIRDDIFARLLTFPNVLITGHQAFFTREALAQIATTTMVNITAFERGEPLINEVRV